MITFLCYPKCSTCKKAQKFLDDNSIEYTLRDIKTDNPDFDELKFWFEKSGLPLKRFFNTSGLLYKSMELKYKLPQMSEEERMLLNEYHKNVYDKIAGYLEEDEREWLGEQCKPM